LTVGHVGVTRVNFVGTRENPVTVSTDLHNVTDDFDGLEASRDVRLDMGVAWMRAAGEPTRLRLLALLDRVDLTVSELIAILDQSQPRISRHLKLLVEAGLAERFQEGAWAYFRTIDRGAARSFLDAILKPLAEQDSVLAEDSEKLEAVRKKRAERASSYFASNAEDWDKIRSLHVAEDQVEDAMLDMGLREGPQTLFDLGTGTGRILELFAPHVRRGVGIDTSQDMLSVARSTIAASGMSHLHARHGDVYKPGTDERFDLVVLHQVLHFLDDPALALRQAKWRLAREGRLLIVDFAPHEHEVLRDEHAHLRLGMSTKQIARWCELAGLRVVDERMLQSTEGVEDPLTVAIWLVCHADDEGFEGNHGQGV